MGAAPRVVRSVSGAIEVTSSDEFLPSEHRAQTPEGVPTYAETPRHAFDHRLARPMSAPRRPEPVLPDVLAPGLAVVFCGTAAGRRSAAEGAYYAHPGNVFWRALHQTGLTPRLLMPAEFPQLPALGIGLTDLAKQHAGNDVDLPREAFDVAALLEKIERYQPRVLAFTSKTAAQLWQRDVTDYGLQRQRIGGSQVVVLPSPSGQARRYWTLEPWRQLAALCRAG
jgi:TDG/mug DNA glycosylase family protein